MTRVCKSCGAPIEPDYLFCMECGAPIEQGSANPEAATAAKAPSKPASSTCPACGTPVNPGDLFCGQCGATLAPAGNTAPEPEPAPTPEPEPAPEPAEPEQPAFEAPEDDATTLLVEEPQAHLLRQSNGETIELAFPAIVGKGSAATCRFSGNSAISRKHLKIDSELDGGDCTFFAENLGSTNKTVVDGVTLESGERAPLHDGSQITLANEDFTFLIDE